MNNFDIVLMINHRESACGVHQFGKRNMMPLFNSNRYKCYYIDIDNEYEHNYWIRELNPRVVLYNYYSGATMPWLTSQKVTQVKNQGRKTLSFYHELDLSNMGFDLILHQDPTNDIPGYHNMVRHIPEYVNKFRTSKNLLRYRLPKIGSFGFGLGGKGFGNIIRRVIQEFHDVEAIIRFNIPFAYFGDRDGNGARDYVAEGYELVKDYPLIDLTISHNLLPENELLDFLAQNDINCFFYDENYGRGISGVLDYALAVKRPIAITKSWQFKHVWHYGDEMLIEHNSLQDIITRGADYLERYHKMWNTKTHIENIEQAFDKVLGKV